MLFESLVEIKKFTSKVVFIVLIYTTMIVQNKTFENMFSFMEWMDY